MTPVELRELADSVESGTTDNHRAISLLCDHLAGAHEDGGAEPEPPHARRRRAIPVSDGLAEAVAGAPRAVIDAVLEIVTWNGLRKHWKLWEGTGATDVVGVLMKLRADTLEEAAREAERGIPNNMQEPERIVAARLRALAAKERKA